MANNTFQIKRTTVTGRTPNTTNSANSQYINTGELALNLTDYKMFTSNGTAYFEVGANVTNQNVTSLLTINTVSANGTNGSSGQVLTSNGTSTYWAGVSTSINTAAQYSWTNTHTFAANTTMNANLSINAGLYVVSPVNPVIQLIGQNSGVTAPGFVFVSMVTAGAANIVSGDWLGYIDFQNQTYQPGARIYVPATENQNSTAIGTKMVFATANNLTNTLVDRMTINNDGTVLIVNTVTMNNKLSVNGAINTANVITIGGNTVMDFYGGAVTDYTAIWSSDGNRSIILGGGGSSPDAQNYYRNVVHNFQTVGGTNLLLQISNAQITASVNSTFSTNITVGNSTVNTYINATSSNSTTYYSGAINATSVGYLANSTTIVVGNTSVNTTITQLAHNANNATTGFIANATTVFVGNTTANTWANTTYIKVGASNTAAAATSNGYTTLPNGVKMMWGALSVNSTGQVVTFSTNVGLTLTSNCLSVMATSNLTTATYQAAVYSINSTAFTVKTANATATTVYWHAIGV